MHRENLIIVALTLALCLPFLRLLTLPAPFPLVPLVTVPIR